VEAECKAAEKELSKVQSRVAQLEKAAGKADKAATKATDEMKKQQERQARVRKAEEEASTAALDCAKVQNGELLQENKKLQSQLDEMTQSKVKAETRATKLKSKVVKLNKAEQVHAEAKAQNGEILEENKKLQSQLNEMTTSKVKAEERATKLKSKVDNLRELAQATSENFKTMKKAKKEAVRQAKRKQAEIETLLQRENLKILDQTPQKNGYGRSPCGSSVSSGSNGVSGHGRSPYAGATVSMESLEEEDCFRVKQVNRDVNTSEPDMIHSLRR
jgi:chromosome segregation ATPase